MDYFNKWFYWETKDRSGFVYFTSISTSSGNCYGWAYNSGIKFSSELGYPDHWNLKCEKTPNLQDRSKKRMVKDCFEKIILF